MSEINKLKDLINKPLYIRGKQIINRIWLAPMARLGNIAFRELILSYGGCGLLFSEMVSAKSLPSGGGHYDGMQWSEAELPTLMCQIFGNDPIKMADAANWAEKKGFFGVDLNFGCAMGTVKGKGYGAALLEKPKLAGQIVETVRNAITVPLSIKFRDGIDGNVRKSIDIAKCFENSGADFLTYHPRNSNDIRTHRPKWENISKIKEAVSIPVFGNGDVFCAKDSLKMFTLTGCDGIVIGRQALARPWIFSVLSGTGQPIPSEEVAMSYGKLLQKYFDQPRRLQKIKQWIYYFSANFVFGHGLRSRLSTCDSFSAVMLLLADFFAKQPKESEQLQIALLR